MADPVSGSNPISNQFSQMGQQQADGITNTVTDPLKKALDPSGIQEQQKAELEAANKSLDAMAEATLQRTMQAGQQIAQSISNNAGQATANAAKNSLT